MDHWFKTLIPGIRDLVFQNSPITDVTFVCQDGEFRSFRMLFRDCSSIHPESGKVICPDLLVWEIRAFHETLLSDELEELDAFSEVARLLGWSLSEFYDTRSNPEPKTSKIRINNIKNTCSICDKTFSSPQALRNHSARHSEDRPFQCLICEKSFITKATLQAHVRLHEQPANKLRPFSCEHCTSSFNNASNLMRHIRSFHYEHSDKKEFLCQDCGKNFKDPSALGSHRKIHAGVRPYVCEDCQKSFITATQLRVHQRIHKGERPFLCVECGRSFTTSGQLKSHTIHRHVGVESSKKFLCSECGVSFVKECDLKTHQLKHSGEKPFDCEECGRAFRSDRQLRDHARTHSGEKPFKCETCHKAFSAPAGLRSHFKVKDDCRSNASEGAYSIKPNKRIKYDKVELAQKILNQEVGEDPMVLQEDDGSGILLTRDGNTIIVEKPLEEEYVVNVEEEEEEYEGYFIRVKENAGHYDDGKDVEETIIIQSSLS